jgi:membrane protein
MPEQSDSVLEPGGNEAQTAAGGARRYRKPIHSVRWRDIGSLLADSFDGWSRHKIPRLGASLAFYTLLSITPLLLVAVSVAGLVFGRAAAQADLVKQVQDLVGAAGAEAVEALLEGSKKTSHGVVATVFGLITLLFGASGALVELRDALNTIWEVPGPRITGNAHRVKLFLKERLFSFALALSVGFLLLVSLAINAWIAALGKFSAVLLPAPEFILDILSLIFSFVLITALFAAIYKVMPDVRLEWRDVLLGAAVTSLFFNVGKFLIGMYLGKASFASTYGAAASIVVFIVWVYYSGQVFFLGAEFTKTFASRYGSQPTRYREGMVVAGGSDRKREPARIITSK